MKNRLFIIVVLIFLFCRISWPLTASAVSNPADLATVPPSGVSSAISNPADLATIPPSSIRSGLFRSPNPIDTSGNLVITGNVAGGRHFRGIVPYQATSQFWGSLESSSLTSFLRRSAGSENLEFYTGTFTPYYTPSAAVTTTGPGHSGVFSPLTPRVTGRPAEQMALPSLQRYYDAGIAYYSGLRKPYFTITPQTQTRRPLSMTPLELQKLISAQISEHPQPPKVTAQQYQARMEQFQQDIKQLTAQTDSDVLQPFQLQTQSEQPDRAQQLDVYEQMKQEIDEFQELLERLAAAEQPQEAAEGQQESNESTSGLPPISREIQKKDSPLDESRSIRRPPEMIPDEFSNFQLAARAKAILGKHKTFASFSKDKFNQHLSAAEAYLKQGKYYRAADAYTLASIYKPNDPLACAGKSHALFAAGEYISSALFLSRALQIFPEYARFKIDLVAMIGDRDKLANRIVDVQQCQQVSGSAELQFLLAYIYYQMGRLELAKEAIDQACQKMPNAPAVLAVKKAIEEQRELKL